MKTFFTSDEHYGHENIIGFCGRPFSDAHEMTLGLIANHNRVVGKDDFVWHLGDFCWKPADVADVLAQLNGRHGLICGNHDACHPMHKAHSREMRRYLGAGFERVETAVRIVLDADNAEPFQWNGTLELNHMPFVPDERHDGRHVDWMAKDIGQLLFHGHVHNAWKVSGRAVNVGVDVWDYTPTTLDRLVVRYREGNS